MFNLKVNPWSVYWLSWQPFKHNTEGCLQIDLKRDPITCGFLENFAKYLQSFGRPSTKSCFWLYQLVDGMAMRSPLGLRLTNAFLVCFEKKNEKLSRTSLLDLKFFLKDRKFTTSLYVVKQVLVGFPPFLSYYLST